MSMCLRLNKSKQIEDNSSFKMLKRWKASSSFMGRCNAEKKKKKGRLKHFGFYTSVAISVPGVVSIYLFTLTYICMYSSCFHIVNCK